MTAPSKQTTVAIIGGGLCGLGLACALTKRQIPYEIYEARGSFQELGAGINIGPNTLEAFRLIDASLSSAFLALCSGNPAGKEEVWMQLRVGAPLAGHADASLLAELMAPPTGNMTVSRNELLQLLAEKAGLEHAVFGKKLAALEQNADEVRMTFADGSVATAGVVVACDGIHSAVRAALLPPGDAAAVPHYSGHGAYRAVLPAAEVAAALSEEMASTSHTLLGPDGYIIMYPIDGGKNVNVGLWAAKPGDWSGRAWMMPQQGEAMRKQFEHWGPAAYKIMALVGDAPFFATHHHSVQPESCLKGRVCLIGDAAHAMPPHQGAGSGQAMEDAYVMSEVLEAVTRAGASQAAVERGLQAYEAVRQPRSQKVLETSVEAFGFWSEIYKHGTMTEADVQSWVEEAQNRFLWIWNVDLARDARRAVDMLDGVHGRSQT